MHVDLPTLYFLAIGTLLASAGMTLWERAARPERRRELATWAAGYAALAIGCVVASVRHALPGASGAALANLLILAGYMLLLDGIGALTGRRYVKLSVGLLVAQALAWGIAGARWQGAMWNFGSAAPIALVSALAARAVLRACPERALRSRWVVAAVTGGHGLFYLLRATALPLLAAHLGPALVATASKVTMYEGVLYSVLLPMALLALIREEAHGQLLRASRTDFLTGLGNRQWFFEEGARMLRKEASGPVALLAFDLDHFKAINDRYGHAAGDKVLASFASIVRTMLPSGAIIARMGGEEFAALLPGHDGVHAHEAGRAVSTRFAGAAVQCEPGVSIKATVSIGIAVAGTARADLPSLLSNADSGLYAAKARGRNRLEFAPPAAIA